MAGSRPPRPPQAAAPPGWPGGGPGRSRGREGGGQRARKSPPPLLGAGWRRGMRSGFPHPFCHKNVGLAGAVGVGENAYDPEPLLLVKLVGVAAQVLDVLDLPEGVLK